jgi:dTDP-4-amino-4,6-dideoxygalactose transaminase
VADEALEPIHFARPAIDASDIEAVVRVLESGWLSTGDECRKLEAELAAEVGAPHVVAVSSCTAALQIALDAQRFAPGARVGVPTWTFAASANTVVHAGAQPVLLDVDADTLNVSLPAVEAALAEGLDALVVVHFAGVAVDRAVLDLAAEHGVPVIEDAAHAIGTSDHRGPVSGLGTVGAAFSFYATKNLTSGEGGALATHDDELASFARRHRLHGLSQDAWARYQVGGNPTYDLVEPGLKANLPDLLAALARTQLARFPDLQARRRQITTRYRELLASSPEVRCVPGEPDPRSADHLFVVILPEGVDRAEVVSAMGKEQIGVSVHFRPVHTFGWYAEHADVGPGGVPVADALADRALSLPLHPGLSDADVDRVVGALGQALR